MFTIQIPEKYFLRKFSENSRQIPRVFGGHQLWPLINYLSTESAFRTVKYSDHGVYARTSQNLAPVLFPQEINSAGKLLPTLELPFSTGHNMPVN